MLSSKAGFSYKLAQRCLAVRYQYSGTFGETPGFDPQNPPPGIDRKVGKKASVDEIEERIQEGKEYGEKLYSRDSYIGRPLDRLDKEKELEVDQIVHGMKDKIETIAEKAEEIEEVANQAKDMAQKVEKKLNWWDKIKKNK